MQIEYINLSETPDLSLEERSQAEQDLQSISEKILKDYFREAAPNFMDALLTSVTPSINEILEAVEANSIDKASKTLSEMIQQIGPEVLNIPEKIGGFANIQALLPSYFADKIDWRDALVLLALLKLRFHLGDSVFFTLAGGDLMRRFSSIIVISQEMPLNMPILFTSKEGLTIEVKITETGSLFVLPISIDYTQFVEQDPQTFEHVSEEVDVMRERLQNVIKLIG